MKKATPQQAYSAYATLCDSRVLTAALRDELVGIVSRDPQWAYATLRDTRDLLTDAQRDELVGVISRDPHWAKCALAFFHPEDLTDSQRDKLFDVISQEKGEQK